MKQKESNYQEMVRRVLAHFDLHTAAWTGEAPVAARVARLRAVNEALSAQAGSQRRSGGVVGVKDDTLQEAAGMAALLATRLRSLARHLNDPLLLRAVDLSESDFRYGAEEARIGHMNDILDKAQELSAPAAAFKVRSADIDALRAALDGAGALRQKAADGRTHLSTATARIPALIEDARSELEALDDDVPALVDDAAFVDAYFVARRITDRRATRPAGAPAAQGS